MPGSGSQYIALSGLRARADELDRLASDIANVGTAGYKGERDTTAAAERPTFDRWLQSAIDTTHGGRRLDMTNGALAPTGRPLDVALDGDVDRLPEPHRTCVYRVVQEALTNCARHAHATQVGVSLRRDTANLRLLIHDDGVGLQDQARSREGLGLLGIEERIKELQGILSIHSTNGAGTTLRVEIPVPDAVEEESLATRSSG